jgi:hypothetical protein
MLVRTRTSLALRHAGATHVAGTQIALSVRINRMEDIVQYFIPQAHVRRADNTVHLLVLS